MSADKKASIISEKGAPSLNRNMTPPQTANPPFPNPKGILKKNYISRINTEFPEEKHLVLFAIFGFRLVGLIRPKIQKQFI